MIVGVAVAPLTVKHSSEVLRPREADPPGSGIDSGDDLVRDIANENVRQCNLPL